MTRTNPKLATCERCKSQDVTWFQSKSKGTYYLCEVFMDDEGDRVASNRDFHSKYCGKPEVHAARQAELTGTPDVPAPSDDLAEQRALEISILSTVDKVLAIADLSRENRLLALLVARIWAAQGENMLVEIMNGALGLTSTD